MLGIMDVQIIKICLQTWRSFHDKGVEEMNNHSFMLCVVILYQEKEKQKFFIGYLSYSKQGAAYFCALLSDLSPYYNFVSRFFFPLIIEKGN